MSPIGVKILSDDLTGSGVPSPGHAPEMDSRSWVWGSASEFYADPSIQITHSGGCLPARRRLFVPGAVKLAHVHISRVDTIRVMNKTLRDRFCPRASSKTRDPVTCVIEAAKDCRGAVIASLKEFEQKGELIILPFFELFIHQIQKREGGAFSAPPSYLIQHRETSSLFGTGVPLGFLPLFLGFCFLSAAFLSWDGKHSAGAVRPNCSQISTCKPQNSVIGCKALPQWVVRNLNLSCTLLFRSQASILSGSCG